MGRGPKATPGSCEEGEYDMPSEYHDCTGSLRLWLAHRMAQCRRIPLRGMGFLARLGERVLPSPPPGAPCLIRTLQGFRILVDPTEDRGLELALFRQGTYEHGTLSFIRQALRPGDVFLDVGANIGLMSLCAASALRGTGKVLSFEPMKATFETLTRNIQFNGFGNIEAFNLALGAADAHLEMFDSLKSNRGAASLIRPEGAAAGQRVAIRRLDDVLAERAVERVACVKMDVEGWELEVLKGAQRLLSSPDAPLCILECSKLHAMQGGSVGDLYRFVRGINAYRVFRLSRGKEMPSALVEIHDEASLPAHDNLFCLLPRHIDSLPRSLVKG